MAETRILELKKTGQKVCLVPRASCKAPATARRLVRAVGAGRELPVAPRSLDLTDGGRIDLPMLGNDEVGNCYLVDAYHAAQIWEGRNGRPLHLNTQDVIDEYFTLTGGDDVGLYTDQLMNHFYRGLDHADVSIIDWAVIPHTDADFVKRVCNAYGGTSFTLGIPDRWLDLMEPDAVIDAGRRDRANPWNGHAMTHIGWNADGYCTFATWGFRIHLTPRALAVCDPEFIAWVSQSWVQNGNAPNGMKRSELATHWPQIGGEEIDLGPDDVGPGPGPQPGTFTIPAGPYTLNLGQALVFKQLVERGEVDAVKAALPRLNLAQLLELIRLILDLLSQRGEPAAAFAGIVGGVRDRGGPGPHPATGGKHADGGRSGAAAAQGGEQGPLPHGQPTSGADGGGHTLSGQSGGTHSRLPGHSASKTTAPTSPAR